MLGELTDICASIVARFMKLEAEPSTLLFGGSAVLWTSLLGNPSTTVRGPPAHFMAGLCILCPRTYSTLPPFTIIKVVYHAQETFAVSATKSLQAALPREARPHAKGHGGRLQASGLAHSAPTLSQLRSTGSLSLFLPTRTVRNDSWTFESVVTTHGTKVAEGGIWAYDVAVQGRSVAQVGWKTAGARSFNPLEGQGVGDIQGSFAFDGERCKLWRGAGLEGLDYGRRWTKGVWDRCLMGLEG
jgi:hypothetical protein